MSDTAGIADANRLPAVNRVGMGAPFRWLARGWGDLMKAPVPCLLYGVALAVVSYGLWTALVQSNLAFWALALTCGFVFVAPILAMGLYEAGRSLESGKRPSLGDMLFVKGALRLDVFYLGLALLLVYLLWGRIAQIVYGLSTWRLHTTVDAFLDFALRTPEGHNMLVAGSIVGAIVAFFTFSLVVVSAPMLLDGRANVFSATVTSFTAVARNLAPLLLWAVLIAALTALAAAPAFAGLAIVFPWLGLASWRAYRDLVAA